MRRTPAIRHVGKGRAVALTGRLREAGYLLPLRRIDRRETGIAVRAGVNLGDFETVREAQALRIDVRAADLSDRTPQRVGTRQPQSSPSKGVSPLDGILV